MTGRIAPHVPDCSVRSADAWVRGRVLTLRRRPRGSVAQVAVVVGADVERDVDRAADLVTWCGEPGRATPRDHGWRTDLALRLLVAPTGPRRRGRDVVVLTREGPLEVLADDERWARGVAHASGVLGRPVPPLLVVTRWGWHCLPDGRSRWWRRLRDRTDRPDPNR